ncbi:MAG TPA: type II toxin-antitoxin system PrlF family antitoxin [Quisquiliibacterium sp.]|nr:MAG: type II toxin-antitoxin system PrlF family antitoxin [Burkholderiaceae bacterium]HQD82755.1 type II toxin-antitoxin system PrlF family antitoxin [Quisquiliibacterium sp.]
MSGTLQAESTLTDRYQTTVPDTVRRVLRLGKRDKIRYTIRPDGEVVLSRAAAGEGNDPALAPFLGFLARDLAEHPERLQAVDPGLAQRIQALVGTVDVDLDAPLSADDE